MSSEKCSLLIDYFNGALRREDKEAFERHLETCYSCQDELEELEILTADLPYLSESVTPPDNMKKRILSNVTGTVPEKETAQPRVTEQKKQLDIGRIPRKRKNGVNPWTIGLAACLALSLIGNIYTVSENAFQNNANQPSNQKVAKVLFNIPLGATQSDAQKMRASAAMVKSNKDVTLFIQAQDLKPTKGNQVYQVWLINDGKPVPAGSFKPNQNGSGTVSYNMKQGKQWDAVAISLESAPNHKQPKGTIYMQGKL
ncbi:putative zinc finger protein [Scopulibacillus darangshiensis]|uniref:Anti-sigma-W factor RsiW n=1 Tax=Scopulibacillus darangshiensis TaxID=442528 RepID=A0A4R2NXW1_9BACL|nr:anti-sigma factor [Scopulibacillus darangshiensis]TCP27079.1 putative zinc finger protein [Scopulibacillus darangshiensis]